jgi:hypothetical protein
VLGTPSVPYYGHFGIAASNLPRADNKIRREFSNTQDRNVLSYCIFPVHKKALHHAQKVELVLIATFATTDHSIMLYETSS